MSYFKDNSLSIGNTPLVQIRKLGNDKALVLGKVEGRNPSYSVKCRIGASMIWDAEDRGVLKPGAEIIEPTSGNTGIALAYVGAARGYKVTLTMPDTMSIERMKILQALGANLVLTPGDTIGIESVGWNRTAWDIPIRSRKPLLAVQQRISTCCP